MVQWLFSRYNAVSTVIIIVCFQKIQIASKKHAVDFLKKHVESVKSILKNKTCLSLNKVFHPFPYLQVSKLAFRNY